MATAEKKTTKHTRGPWECENRTDDFGKQVYYVATDERGNVVADTLNCGCTMDPNEQKANMQICAAAPDMLAACRIALEAIRDAHHGISTADREAMIEQAIAKAEGRD